MNNFYSVFTYTPCDNLNTNLLTEVKLLSLKSITKTFVDFFEDPKRKKAGHNGILVNRHTANYFIDLDAVVLVIII